jgi:hypothetical protein
MIQRKQTLYLVLMVLLISSHMLADATIFEGVGILNNNEGKVLVKKGYQTLQLGSGNNALVTNSGLTAYTFSAIGLLALISIFLFKNRKLQATICALNFLLMLVYVYLLFAETNRLNLFDINWHWTAFTPIVLPVFNILALRGIFADEKLIQSMDRLR